MRVLQIVQRPQRRGAEIFALQLSDALERRGHATAVVYLYRGDDRLAPRPQDRLLEGDSERPSEKFPGVQTGLLDRLRAAIADFGPDVVQVNGARTVKYGSLARRLDRGAGWALVYRSIGNPRDWTAGLRRRLYKRLVVSRVDGIVAVSGATLESLERCYQPRVPAVVIPRGVDPRDLVPETDRAEARLRLGTPSDAPVALFAGSLTPEKRPDRLLRVAARVLQELAGAELWILGDGPLLAATRGQLAATDWGARVRLLGVQQDVATYMGAADVLFLASDTEGTPGVILEAACLGLPAVATRVGGVAECVLDGVSGLLEDLGDEPGLEERLAGALLRLLQGGDERRRLGRAAREHVLGRFSLEHVAGSYVEFYDEVRKLRGRAS